MQAHPVKTPNGTARPRARFRRVVALVFAAGLSTVFTAASAHAATSGVLYTFSGGNDGANPASKLIDVGGVLYGTTTAGGGSGCGGIGCGTVFSVTPGGVEKVIYSFQGGMDGFYPHAGLIKVGTKLYGTTAGNQNCDAGTKRAICGTVFSITPSGVHKVLHVFKGGTGDGAEPYGNLVDLNGTLYGTTLYGGDGVGGGFGTVFSITPSGVEKLIYKFTTVGLGRPNGLTNVGGTLYGNAYGSVYAITPSGDASILHTFNGGKDGKDPTGTVVDLNGILYGATGLGGRGGCLRHDGCGTVFKLSPGTKTESLIYAFRGKTAQDVTTPIGSLTYFGGTFYGNAAGGGNNDNYGGVYAVTRLGVENVLAIFDVAMGEAPQAGLINVKGTLYGTAFYYGHNNGPGPGCGNGAGCGTVFWVKP